MGAAGYCLYYADSANGISLPTPTFTHLLLLLAIVTSDSKK